MKEWVAGRSAVVDLRFLVMERVDCMWILVNCVIIRVFNMRCFDVGWFLFHIKRGSGTAGHIGWYTRATEASSSGTGNGSTHVSVDIVVCLVGCEFPLCFWASGEFLEKYFGFTSKETINWHQKWGGIFPFIKAGKEIFVLIFLLL